MAEVHVQQRVAAANGYKLTFLREQHNKLAHSNKELVTWAHGCRRRRAAHI